MGNPHVVVIPWPAQGHVIPLMEFSLCLVEHGCRVTFVNTEFNHNRVMNAFAERRTIGDQLRLVSVPGLEFHEDKERPAKLTEGIWQFMPQKVEELMEEINSVDGDGITCVVSDQSIGWGLEIAAKMGIPQVAFFPASALVLALGQSVPKLIEDGVINCDGIPIEHQMIQLSPTAPAINTKNFPWVRMGNVTMQKTTFEIGFRNREAAEKADWFFSNSTYDFEPAAFALIPKLIPIGPLVASNRHGNSAGNFWPEDQTCLEWLNQQPPCSVIYVAFGSSTIFNQTQFQELALGLELSNMPFLWVVRPDSTDGKNDAYPEGFQDRVATQGQIVGWAPQRKVLGHPSVACFLSHCGWNSTVEGVSNGVPFLCWPYFADQFVNETYICDVWKIGLGFNPDENGIITRKEIKNKVGQLLGDEKFRSRALNLKEIAIDSVKEGGPSHNNFKNFVEWLKA
ncbi:UDP-glycosyltransferase 83A1-like [Vitis riparia]|uniref:UDP-glycosyltransferase 83A1-like n=1 Tax=Vitis riparia TaxID=96939 RepID=UPI00155A200C|nr:UDP-glycosyltransferase 83A1-like [Vitis riparia]